MIRPLDSGSAQSWSSAQQQRLADLLDEYLRQLEAGTAESPDAFAARYPEYGTALRDGLADLALLQDGLQAMRPLVPRNSIGNDAETSTPEAWLRDSVEDPQSGKRQLGDYQLLRELGRGGMGIVYEARQLSLDRIVALKVLPFAAILDRTQVIRFQNEARAAAQLQHPHIVPIHAVGVERGVHYYVMQFIEGRSLARVLDELRGGNSLAPPTAAASPAFRAEQRSAPVGPAALSAETLAPPQSTTSPGSRARKTGAGLVSGQRIRVLVELARQAAEALHSAHECGVIHRDVKPSNLLVDEQQKLWVTDFGLARASTNIDVTRSGDLLGTLPYMSPEQTAGDSTRVDRRTDIYSLGATLYEMVTGRRVFLGDDPTQILQQIRQGEFIRPRAVNSAIPIDLENVILKAMALQAEDRYRTAQEMADDLQRFLNGEPTRARRLAWSKRWLRWTQRHRRWVLASAALAAIALIGISVGYGLVLQQAARTDRAVRDLELAKGAVQQVGGRAVQLLAQTPGAEHVREEILREMIRYAQRFVDQAAANPALAQDVARTQMELAHLQHQLGHTQQALAAYQMAEEQLLRLAQAGGADIVSHQRWLLRCGNNRALLLRDLGRLSEAEKGLVDAIGLASRWARSETLPAEFRLDLAQAWNTLGLVHADQAHADQARSCCQRALDLLNGPWPDKTYEHPGPRATQAMVYNNLSQLVAGSDRSAAIEWSLQALELQRSLVDESPKVPTLQSELATTSNNVASLFVQSGDLPRAISYYQEASRWQTALQAAEPFAPKHRRDLAATLNNLGLAFLHSQQLDQAETTFEQALGLQRELVKSFPADHATAGRLGGLYNNLAMVYQQRDQWPRAADRLEQAIRYLRFAFEGSDEGVAARDHLSRTYYNYAQVLRKVARPIEAAETSLQRRELWPSDPQQLVAVARELTWAYLQMADDESRWPARKREAIVEEIAETLRRARSAGWVPTSAGDESAKTDPAVAVRPTPGSGDVNGPSHDRVGAAGTPALERTDVVYKTFGTDPRFATIWEGGS